MMSSFRHGVTITGTVLLVAGTLCFAWWSDGEIELFANNTSRTTLETETQPAQTSSIALLRSVSFFCCGAGGLLLLFGLLWSVKTNAHLVTQRYQYNFPSELHCISRELSKKIASSNHGLSTIPTYEEAVNDSSSENLQLFPPDHFVKREHLPPTYTTVIGNGRPYGRPKRSLSDSELQKSPHLGADWYLDPGCEPTAVVCHGTPPPSYENITAHVT